MGNNQFKVISTEYVGGHTLKIFFDDGKISEVDFSGFIFSNNHPDYIKYKIIGEFLKYDITDGNLNWDDYSMIFPVSQLYTGKIEMV